MSYALPSEVTWGSGAMLQLPLAEVVDDRLEGSVNSLQSQVGSAAELQICICNNCTAPHLVPLLCCIAQRLSAQEAWRLWQRWTEHASHLFAPAEVLHVCHLREELPVLRSTVLLGRYSGPHQPLQKRCWSALKGAHPLRPLHSRACTLVLMYAAPAPARPTQKAETLWGRASVILPPLRPA